MVVVYRVLLEAETCTMHTIAWLGEVDSVLSILVTRATLQQEVSQSSHCGTITCQSFGMRTILYDDSKYKVLYVCTTWNSVIGSSPISRAIPVDPER